MSTSKPPRILGNRLLILPLPNVESAGIVIPETVKPRTDYGRIIAIGNGSKIPQELKVGQRLRIDTSHGAQDAWVDGVKHQIVSIYDTVAIMDYAERH